MDHGILGFKRNAMYASKYPWQKTEAGLWKEDWMHSYLNVQVMLAQTSIDLILLLLVCLLVCNMEWLL